MLCFPPVPPKCVVPEPLTVYVASPKPLEDYAVFEEKKKKAAKKKKTKLRKIERTFKRLSKKTPLRAATASATGP